MGKRRSRREDNIKIKLSSKKWESGPTLDVIKPLFLQAWISYC